MFDLINKMKDLQSKMEETKIKLENTKVVGINRDASVKVTVNGARRVLDIEIDDSLYNQSNKALLIQSLKDAMHDATVKSEQLIKEEMKDSIPQIPGFNFE